MTLDLLSIIKKIDAAVLFEYFYTVELEGADGTVSRTSFERLAETLNAAGLRTAREQLFTASVVRLNVKRLEELQVVERIPVSGAEFDLRFRRYKAPARTSEPLRKETPAETSVPDPVEKNSARNSVRSQNDFHNDFHNENENENGAENGTSSPYSSLESININKQINKQTDFLSIEELAEKTPTDSDFFQRFRRLLVRELYEPGLHAELLDRAVLAFAARIVTSREIETAVRKAKEDRALFDRSNGFRGSSTLWRSFALSVKTWYDEAGYFWTPTRNRREPAPERREVEWTV